MIRARQHLPPPTPPAPPAPPGAAIAIAGTERPRFTGPLVCPRTWIIREIIKTPGKYTMSVRTQQIVPAEKRPQGIVVRVSTGWNGVTYGAHPADNRDAESIGPDAPLGGMEQPPWEVAPGHNAAWWELLGSEWVPNSVFRRGLCYEPATLFDGSEEMNHLLAWGREYGPLTFDTPPGIIYLQKSFLTIPESCMFRGAGRGVTSFFRASNIDQPANLKSSIAINTLPPFRDQAGTTLQDFDLHGNRGHMVHNRGGTMLSFGGSTAADSSIIPVTFTLRRLGLFGSGAYGYALAGDGIKYNITVEDVEADGCDTDMLDFKNREQKNRRIYFKKAAHLNWSLGAQGTHVAPITPLSAGSIFTIENSHVFAVARTALTSNLLNNVPRPGTIATFMDGGTVGGINLTNRHYLAIGYANAGPDAVPALLFEAVEMTPVEVAISSANPAFVSWPGTPAVNGNVVRFETDGELPLPINQDDPLYVVNKVTDGFELSLTPGGSAIDTSLAVQYGTHTIQLGQRASATVNYGGDAMSVYMPHRATGDVAFDLRADGLRADECYAEGRLLMHGGFRVRNPATRVPGAIPPRNNVLNGCVVKDTTPRHCRRCDLTTRGQGVAFSFHGIDGHLINPIFDGAGFGRAFQFTSPSREIQVIGPKASNCETGFQISGEGINVTGGALNNIGRAAIDIHGGNANVSKDLPPNAFKALALGSPMVRVNDPNHGLSTGNRLEFHLSNSTTNGLTVERTGLPGDYTIAVVDADNYDIIARRNAASNVNISSANPAVVTWPLAPALADDDPVILSNSNLLLPSPLLNETVYYVVNVATVGAGKTCNLSLTPGGAAISTVGSSQGGVHTIVKVPPGGVGALGAFNLDAFGGDDPGSLPGQGGSPTAVYPPDKNHVARDIHFSNMRINNQRLPNNKASILKIGVVENSNGNLGDYGQADDISFQNIHALGFNGGKYDLESGDFGGAVIDHATNVTYSGNTGQLAPYNTGNGVPSEVWEVVAGGDLTVTEPANRFHFNITKPHVRIEIESAEKSGTGNVMLSVSPNKFKTPRTTNGDYVRYAGAAGTALIIFVSNIGANTPFSAAIEIDNFTLARRSAFKVMGSVDGSDTGLIDYGGFTTAAEVLDSLRISTSSNFTTGRFRVLQRDE